MDPRGDPWDEPRALAATGGERAPFPIEALGEGPLAAAASATARCHGANADMCALVALASANGAIFDSVLMANAKSVKPVGIYWLPGAPTGGEKGSVFGALMGPLTKHDTAILSRWQDECEAIRDDNQGKKVSERERLPANPQRFRHDVTTEGWIRAQAEANRAIGLINSDSGPLVGWSMKESFRHSLSQWCNAYSGETLGYTRARGNSGEGAPDLTFVHSRGYMMIMPQPDVLRRVMASEEMVESGLGGRVICAEFELTVDPGELYADDDPALQAHDERLRGMIGRPSRVVRFEREANERLEYELANMKVALALSEDDDKRLDIRTAELAARIAATLAEYEAVGEGGTGVSLGLYERGLKIAEWARVERRRVRMMAAIEVDERDLLRLLNWMRTSAFEGQHCQRYEDGTYEFSPGDIIQRSPVRKGARRDELLEVLQEHCWVRREKRGRSTVIVLSPYAVETEPTVKRS